MRARSTTTVFLPAPPDRYDREDQAELRRSVELAHQRFVAAQPRQVVTGSKGGNTALASLITALANLGFVTDQTT